MSTRRWTEVAGACFSRCVVEFRYRAACVNSVVMRVFSRRLATQARIAWMKDGRTHMAYKAEHAIGLETEAIVAVQVTHADRDISKPEVLA
jgi:hypothetical protein